MAKKTQDNGDLAIIDSNVMESVVEQATFAAYAENKRSEIVRILDEVRATALTHRANIPSRVGQLLKQCNLDTPYIKGESAMLGKREKENMTAGQKALWDASKNILHKKDVLINTRSKTGVSEVPVIRQVESFFDSILVVLAD